jgi:hypothetical protein
MGPTEGEKMRKLAIMLGMVMLLVVVAAGAAMAVTKQCGDNLPCEGTNNEDTLYEREGTVRDVIYGFGAHDVLDANTFNFDRDRVFGGDQGDKLLTNDGDGRDVVKGGPGRDVCLVDRGDRTVNCEVRRDAQGPEDIGVDSF